MRKADVYAIWADMESLWSQWTKPVLFSFVEHELPAGAERVATSDMSWIPDANTATAIVVDLPGAEGVWFGIEAARRGYRPVPLYNALPFPLPPDPSVRTAVDVESILMALKTATHVLRALTIPPDAPPAFLLDANRRRSRFRLSVGDFDNRSVCFITDFPSGQLLSENGIHTVILVERDSHPEADLVRVLASWQNDGLSLFQKDIGYAVGVAPLHIDPPRWWHRAWQRILNAGLHRSSVGGFGDIVQSAG